MHFINLGGIKLLWGQTAGIATGSTYGITFPTSFFTTIQSGQLTAGPVSGTANVEPTWQTSGLTASGAIISFNASAGSGTMPVNFFVIGT